MTTKVEVPAASINSQNANSVIAPTPGVPEALPTRGEADALAALNSQLQTLYTQAEQKVEQRQQLEQTLDQLQHNLQQQEEQYQRTVDELKQAHSKHMSLLGSFVFLSDFSEKANDLDKEIADSQANKIELIEEIEQHIKTKTRLETDISSLTAHVATLQQQHKQQLEHQGNLRIKLHDLKKHLPQQQKEQVDLLQKQVILDQLISDKENNSEILTDNINPEDVQLGQHRTRKSTLQEKLDTNKAAQERIGILEQDANEMALKADVTQEELAKYATELSAKTFQLQELETNTKLIEENKYQIQILEAKLNRLTQKRAACTVLSELRQATTQQEELLKDLHQEINQSQQQIQHLNEETTSITTQKEMLLKQFAPLEQQMQEQLETLGMKFAEFNHERSVHVKKAASDARNDILDQLLASDVNNTLTGEQQLERINAATVEAEKKHEQAPQELEVTIRHINAQLTLNREQFAKLQNQFEMLIPTPAAAVSPASQPPITQPIVESKKVELAPPSIQKPEPAAQPTKPGFKKRIASFLQRNKEEPNKAQDKAVPEASKTRANSTPTVRISESTPVTIPPATSAPSVQSSSVLPRNAGATSFAQMFMSVQQAANPVQNKPPVDDDELTDDSSYTENIHWGDTDTYNSLRNTGSVTFSIRSANRPQKAAVIADVIQAEVSTPISLRSSAENTMVSTPDTLHWEEFRDSPRAKPDAETITELANNPLSLAAEEFRPPSDEPEAVMAVKKLQTQIDALEQHRSQLWEKKKNAGAGVVDAESKAELNYWERELTHKTPPGSPSVKSQLSPKSQGNYQTNKGILQSATSELAETDRDLQQLYMQLANVEKQFPRATKLAALSPIGQDDVELKNAIQPSPATLQAQPAVSSVAKPDSSREIIISPAEDLPPQKPASTSLWGRFTSAASNAFNSVFSALTTPEVKTTVIKHNQSADEEIEQDEAADEAVVARSVAESEEVPQPTITKSAKVNKPIIGMRPLASPPKAQPSEEEASLSAADADDTESTAAEITLKFADESEFLNPTEEKRDDDTPVLTPTYQPDARKANGNDNTFFDVTSLKSEGAEESDEEDEDRAFLATDATDFDDELSSDEDEEVPLIHSHKTGNTEAVRSQAHNIPAARSAVIVQDNRKSAHDNVHGSSKIDKDNDPLIASTTDKATSSVPWWKRITNLPATIGELFTGSSQPSATTVIAKDKLPAENAVIDTQAKESASSKKKKGVLSNIAGRRPAKKEPHPQPTQEFKLVEVPPQTQTTMRALDQNGLFHGDAKQPSDDLVPQSSSTQSKLFDLEELHPLPYLPKRPNSFSGQPLVLQYDSDDEDESDNEDNSEHVGSRQRAHSYSNSSMLDFHYGQKPQEVHLQDKDGSVLRSHKLPPAPSAPRIERKAENVPDNTLMRHLIEWAKIDADGIERSYEHHPGPDPTIYTATFTQGAAAPEFVVLTEANKVEAFGANCQPNVYLEMVKVLVGDAVYPTPPLVPITITKKSPIDEVVLMFTAVCQYGAVPFIEPLTLPFTHAQIEAALPRNLHPSLAELVAKLHEEDKRDYDKAYGQPAGKMLVQPTQANAYAAPANVESVHRPEMMH